MLTKTQKAAIENTIQDDLTCPRELFEQEEISFFQANRALLSIMNNNLYRNTKFDPQVKQSIEYIRTFLEDGSANKLKLNQDHLMMKNQEATDEDVRKFIKQMISTETQQLEVSRLKKQQQQMRNIRHKTQYMNLTKSDEMVTSIEACNTAQIQCERIIKESKHARFCVVLIENHLLHLTLRDPQISLVSGGVEIKPQKEIAFGGKCGIQSFMKTGLLRGTCGVLSYAIGNSDKRLSIMWQVPYDYNLYTNYYNVAITHKSVNIDEKLFDQLYNSPQKFDEIKDFKVWACMDSGTKSILRVEIREPKIHIVPLSSLPNVDKNDEMNNEWEVFQTHKAETVSQQDAHTALVPIHQLITFTTELSIPNLELQLTNNIDRLLALDINDYDYDFEVDKNYVEYLTK